MANTFLQINLHIVFAVKYRDAILADVWRNELFKYIGGVIHNNGLIPIKIGGWRDHVHILIGTKASIDVAALVKDIKLSTNKWIQPRIKCRFAWQDGYGCFSVSPSHVEALKRYIDDQPQHHSRIGMVDEFKRILMRNAIDFDPRYLPDEIFDR